MGLILSLVGLEVHYGVETCDEFDICVYTEDIAGVSICMNQFSIYMSKGDNVDVNHCISKVFYPVYWRQKEISIGIFSSPESDNTRMASP